MTLEQFFEENPECAIAFSGGTDSVFLLHEACRLGKRVGAYYVQTPLQPAFEREDVLRAAKLCGAELRILEVDILQEEAVVENPPDRCYHCKSRLFSRIGEAAAADGFSFLCDGTNASDEEGDRPGLRALRELGVRSPLRECGLTKKQIREQSRLAGLFTWDKPAYACLATRIPAGEPLTREVLERVERAEQLLFAEGYSDFRVRIFHGAARLQLSERDWSRAMRQRERLLSLLTPLFDVVLLDMKLR